MKISISRCVIAILTGSMISSCANVPPFYIKPDANGIQTKSGDQVVTQKAEDFVLSIDVSPRVGLFDELVYKKRGDYYDKIPAASPVRQYVLAGLPEWTAIFAGCLEIADSKKCEAQKPSKPEDPVKYQLNDLGLAEYQYTLTDLSQRLVALKLFPHEPIAKLECEWTLPKNFKQPPHSTSCEISGWLTTNDEMKGDVTLRWSGHEKKIFFVIPKDKLFVSIGDSYASGEGNPDVPLSNVGEGNSLGTVAWMSRRCHRSLWAAPIRTGLEAAKRPLLSDSSDGVRISVRGAVTVLSAACSGAELSHLTGPGYPGRETLSQMKLALGDSARAAELPLTSIKFDKLSQYRALQSQIQQISGIVNSYSSSKDPHAIDVLMISVGGNDINFGELVRSLILDGNSVSDRQTQIDIQAGIDQLTSGFKELASQIRRNFDAENVYVTPYPDPTRKSRGKPIEYCGCADGSFLGIPVLEKSFFCLKPADSQLASEKIVLPLNKKLHEVSSENGWYFALLEAADAKSDPQKPLDPPYGGRFDGRAWCSPAAERYMRTLGDSMLFQGHLPGNRFESTGAMHPSANGHEVLLAALEHGISEPGKLSVALDSGTAKRGETVFIGEQSSFTFSDTLLAFDPDGDVCKNFEMCRPEISLHLPGDAPVEVICKDVYSDGTCKTNESKTQVTIATKSFSDKARDSNFSFSIRARDSTNKKKYRIVPTFEGKPALALKLDLKEPERSGCQVEYEEGRETEECSKASRIKENWIRGPVKVSVMAIDEKSGIQSWNCVSPVGKCPEEPGEAPLRIEFTHGKHKLSDISFQLKDRVGNTANRETFQHLLAGADELKVDTAFPTIEKIRVFDITFRPNEAVVLPVYRNEKFCIEFDAFDEHSGIQKKTPDRRGKPICEINETVLKAVENPQLFADAQGLANFPISIDDCVGNVASANLQFQVIDQTSSTVPQDSGYWSKQIKFTNPSILDAAKRISGLQSFDDFDSNPPARKLIFSAWLNLASGLLNPSMKISPISDRLSGCKSVVAKRITAFSELRRLTECNMTPNDALIGNLTEKFKSLGFLGKALVNKRSSSKKQVQSPVCSK